MSDNINPRIKTQYQLHDSNGQLRARAISKDCVVLNSCRLRCMFRNQPPFSTILEV